MHIARTLYLCGCCDLGRKVVFSSLYLWCYFRWWIWRLSVKWFLNEPMSVVRGLFHVLSSQIWIRIKTLQPSYFSDCMWLLSPLAQTEVKFFCQSFCKVSGHPLISDWDALGTSLCGLQTKYDGWALQWVFWIFLLKFLVQLKLIFHELKIT